MWKMKRISVSDLDKTFSEEWIITPAKYEQLKDCRSAALTASWVMCEELEEEIADLKARLMQAEDDRDWARGKLEGYIKNTPSKIKE